MCTDKTNATGSDQFVVTPPVTCTHTEKVLGHQVNPGLFSNFLNILVGEVDISILSCETVSVSPLNVDW